MTIPRWLARLLRLHYKIAGGDGRVCRHKWIEVGPYIDKCAKCGANRCRA
jgi:hypothetical protein